MRIVEVQQGSDEWLALRLKHNTASEASAMMSASKNTSRNELLAMRATGSEKEFSDFVKRRIIDKGHEIEAAARPIAEKLIDDDLFPVTVVDDAGYLLASLDGMTMDERIIWECKSWNEAKAASVNAGIVPSEDFWQVVHQLRVTGADRLLYTVTDGTDENTLHLWVEPDVDDFDKLMAGWAQFDEDLLHYTPPEKQVEVIPHQVESLPAIRYQLNGLVLTSNIEQYKAAAQHLVEEARKPLETDQDFADATVRIKAFGDAETKLKAVHDAVLGEIDDVDQFCRDVAEIGEMIRQARLASEKQINRRKKEIRDEILDRGKKSLAAHIDQINQTLGLVVLPPYAVDFAAAMKGKRNIESLNGAVDDALAKAKIELNQIANGIRINLNTYRQVINAGLGSAFRDLQSIISKPADDFALIVSTRIQAEQQKEADRLTAIKEAEERKRQAEEASKTPVVVDAPTQVKSPQMQHREQAEKAAAGSPSFAAQITPAHIAERPTDSEIIAVLARHYSVHESKVIGWLLAMELGAASDSYAANM